MQILLGFFAFWVRDYMCHNCGLGGFIVAYSGAVGTLETPVCAMSLQGC